MLTNPEFIVFTGPMFSAKTSALILSLEKFKYQRKRIELFKPVIDDRYNASSVVTHGGVSLPAKCISVGTDLLKYLADVNEEPHVVAVDEAFMISGVAEVLIYLYKLGFTVVVSSLDLSAAGKPFLEIEKMLPWATQVHKLAAVCTVCGRDAHFTHKKQIGGDEIEVGGSEMYEPRCAIHFPVVFDIRASAE